MAGSCWALMFLCLSVCLLSVVCCLLSVVCHINYPTDGCEIKIKPPNLLASQPPSIIQTPISKSSLSVVTPVIMITIRMIRNLRNILQVQGCSLSHFDTIDPISHILLETWNQIQFIGGYSGHHDHHHDDQDQGSYWALMCPCWSVVIVIYCHINYPTDRCEIICHY